MDADVIVVGGSLSGSALALNLANRGCRVILIEKDEHPRRKVCGEGLSANGVDELGLIYPGIADRPELRPFHGYTVHRGRTASFVACETDQLEGQPARRSCAVSRSILDALLAKRLGEQLTVHTLRGEKVQSVECQADRVVVRLETMTVSAPFAVLAAGARTVIAERLAPVTHVNHRPRIGGCIILQGEERQPLSTVNVFVGDEYQACLTPLPNGAANLSFFGVYDRFARVLARRSFLGPLLARVADATGFVAEPVSSLRGSGMISCGRRVPFSNRVLFIGDCCEQLDPIAGMGMTHALVSARLAAASLHSALQLPQSWQESFQSYSLLREKAIRPLRGFTALSYLNLVQGHRSRLLGSLERSRLAARISRAAHEPLDRPSAFNFLLSTVGALR